MLGLFSAFLLFFSGTSSEFFFHALERIESHLSYFVLLIETTQLVYGLLFCFNAFLICILKLRNCNYSILR
ncbi:hypothetical protein CISIN_1g035189mg [Citrus sinensis]|uniref:Uncharacterized protein n=1 Tax=Citrus sinensis TaxID=2711 RepID=A0A067D4P2_CITSI|nr:hypothetical protein CISIN_1g035189mg [Citrus sinensis]